MCKYNNMYKWVKRSTVILDQMSVFIDRIHKNRHRQTFDITLITNNL